MLHIIVVPQCMDLSVIFGVLCNPKSFVGLESVKVQFLPCRMFSVIFLLPCLLLVGAQHCGREELDSVGERVTACVIRCQRQVFSHYLPDIRKAFRIRPPPSLERSTRR